MTLAESAIMFQTKTDKKVFHLAWGQIFSRVWGGERLPGNNIVTIC